MSPQRVQRKRTKGWRMPENTVYVGRGSKWGSPFQYRTPSALVRYQPEVPGVWEYEGRISADGMNHAYYHPDGTITPYMVRYATRSELVELYRRALLEPDRGMLGAYPSNKGRLITHRTGRLQEQLITITPELVRAELAGKDLACWCAPEHPCHVDILLEVANR
ncbi:DUF4326 domain-containing protein [Paenarthrobacter sp. CAP02]|uniref:DUF4326 domain-containing protein n=1 Tax=Paenarthrobacter sp. CAP02 TaxID=3158144 RepID=UPI0032DB56EE